MYWQHCPATHGLTRPGVTREQQAIRPPPSLPRAAAARSGGPCRPLLAAAARRWREEVEIAM